MSAQCFHGYRYGGCHICFPVEDEHPLAKRNEPAMYAVSSTGRNTTMPLTPVPTIADFNALKEQLDLSMQCIAELAKHSKALHARAISSSWGAHEDETYDMATALAHVARKLTDAKLVASMDAFMVTL